MAESLAPSTPNAHADSARLIGAPLALARGAWIVFTLVSVGLLVAAMPLAYQQMITPRTGPQCADTRLTAAQLGALHAAGISSAVFATAIILVKCYSVLVYVGVAVLLFWRRSDNRMALFASTTLVLLGVAANDDKSLGATCALLPHWPAAALVFELLGVAGSMMTPMLLYLFPSGRWVPRWTRWLMLPWLVVSVPPSLRPAALTDFLATYRGAGNLIAGFLFATCLVAQVYRYRRVSTPAERLQTKWVVLGSGIGLGGAAALIGWGAFGAYNPTAVNFGSTQLWAGSLISFCFTLIPISIGIALLRSRLFDVDQLINRVLVYGSLTTIVGLLYLGVVVALQRLSGQTQPLLVVLSTLAIAALVAPLRRALQRGIDRRFYRHQYDAARTLAAFSATLRDEVDLGRLREDLLAVVEATMRPRHVSLWLPTTHPALTSEPPAGQRAKG